MDYVSAAVDLSHYALGLWDSTQEALRSQGTWQDSDVQALERYVRAVDLVHRLREAIGNDFLVEGSRGQPRPNPLLKTLHETDKLAAAYADALILNPRTRLRHKVASGEVVDDLEDLLS